MGAVRQEKNKGLSSIRGPVPQLHDWSQKENNSSNEERVGDPMGRFSMKLARKVIEG